LLLVGSGCSRQGNSPSPSNSAPASSESALRAKTTEDAAQTTEATDGPVQHPRVPEILEHARQAILNIEDPSERAVLLAEAAAALAKSGQASPSAELFQSAIKIANSVEASDTGDFHAKAYALAEIAQKQAEAGAFDAALQTAASLTAFQGPYVEHDQPQAYALIAYSQAKRGSARAGIDTANGIHNDYWKAFALTEIAVIQSQSAGLNAGASTFEDAAAAARLVPSRSLRTAALANVAGRSASIGEAGRARKMVNEANQIAGSEPDPWLQASALESIAEAQAEYGDVEGVLQTIAAIRRCQFYQNLRGAADEAKQGDFADAIAFMRSGTEPGWRVLRIVAKSQSKSGDFQAALKMAEYYGKGWPRHRLGRNP
jgi:hypothetical protein